MMENGSLIGALAIFTIGAALIIAVLAAGRFLKDPKNRGHAKNTLIDDGPSASSRQQNEDGRPVKERLDQSQASMHPDDPAVKGTR